MIYDEMPTAEILAEHGKDARMIVRSVEPLNIETRIDALEGAITPLPLFFVRNNDTIAQISPEQWTLRVDGLVERPFTLGYDELRRMPATSYIAVVQCCGNSRVRFADGEHEAEGIQWCNGAISNAEWVGVPLRLLFERAGVHPTALQVECIGGDAARTTRGVELDKLYEDAILAYAMNGQPLSELHGGPVRLVVPGWGGINWIKWIVGLHVLDRESDSIYNQQKYVLLDKQGKLRGKVRETRVASVISNIAAGAQLSAGAQPVRGFAWSPGGGVVSVDVSADGGTTWQPARMLADLGPHSWRQFEWLWDAPVGAHVLATRATDAEGNVQPLTVEFNRQGYLMNAIQQVPVEVVG